MKAVQVQRLVQSVEELQVSSVSDPVVGDNDVLVSVRAIGLNFFDILQVQGKYQFKPPLPFVPGAEVAGVIIKVGPKVKGYKVGDRVFGTGPNHINGFAELVAINATPGILFPIPPGITFAEAAAMFMIYPTSQLALDVRANLRPGEVVLVHAAAGGVGIAAVQIAKSMGATVIATAGSDAKCAIAKREGADHVINYVTDKDWVNTVNAITAAIPGRKSKGADVIYDPVGYFIKDTSCVAWNGRILVVGFAGTGGAIEAVPANRLLLKGASLVGVFWGGSTMNDRPAVEKTWMGVFELFTKTNPATGKKFKPVVYTEKRYVGLESIPGALKDLGARKTWGKVVVELPETGSKL